jgi:hypothetical protein
MQEHHFHSSIILPCQAHVKITSCYLTFTCISSGSFNVAFLHAGEIQPPPKVPAALAPQLGYVRYSLNANLRLPILSDILSVPIPVVLLVQVRQISISLPDVVDDVAASKIRNLACNARRQPRQEGCSGLRVK